MRDGRSTWLLVGETSEWVEMATKFMDNLSKSPLAGWRVTAGLVKVVNGEDFVPALTEILLATYQLEQLVVAYDPGLGMRTMSSHAYEECARFNFPAEERLMQSEQVIDQRLESLHPRITNPEPSLATTWLSSREAYDSTITSFNWMAMWGATEEDQGASVALDSWAVRFRSNRGRVKGMRNIYGGPK